jgi:hypothetical protein
MTHPLSALSLDRLKRAVGLREQIAALETELAAIFGEEVSVTAAPTSTAAAAPPVAARKGRGSSRNMSPEGRAPFHAAPHISTFQTMKSPFLSFVSVCTLSLLLVGCASTSHHQTAWEYKIVPMVFDRNPGAIGPMERRLNEASHAEKSLNDLATQGWVLVSESSSDDTVTFILKRRVQP